MRRTLRWVGMFLLLCSYSAVYAQTYVPTNSGVNAGNPGGIRTAYDNSTTGYTNIYPNLSTDATNDWSAVQTIPFTFNFAGNPVSKFVISQNGLMSFDTTVAGTAVNTALNTNTTLPNASLPNNTVAYYWDDFVSINSGDVVYMGVEGTAPNRQLWILHYSYKLGATSYAYFAVVLEETTNRIYAIDMNYWLSGGVTATIGVQLNSTTAFEVTSGINSAAGSPNIVMGTGGSAPTDNEYYQFDFYAAGSLIPPLNVQVTGTTTTTASFSWNAVMSPATAVDIEYGVAGFTQGAGTTVTGVTGTSTTLNTLNPSTPYEFYIRSSNSSAQSNWTGPYSFSTLCAPIASFPYSESFDNAPWANATSTNGSSGNQTHTLAPCWSTATTSASTTSALQWWVYSGTTPSGFSSTGPTGDHTTGSDNYVFVEASSGLSNTDTAFFITPEFDLDTLTTPELSFFYYAFGSNIGSYGVQASTDGGLTWSTVWSASGAAQSNRTTDPWEEMIIDVSSYSSANTSFRFFSTKTGTFGDFAIDDVGIAEAPPCPKVTAVNMAACGTTADLSWTSGGTAFNLEWGPSGFTQGTGMTTTVNGLDTTITGLFPSTAYDVYIQNNCSSAGNGTSVWTGPFTFNTALAAPHLEEFNTTSFPPAQWSRSQGIAANPTVFTNTSSSSWGYGAMGYVTANTYAARINQYGTGHYHWLISPLIDLGDGTVPMQLEFDAALTPWLSTSTSTFGVDDTVLVVISTDGGATWNRSDRIFELNSSNTVTNGTGDHYVVSLAGYTGCVKLAFYTESTVSNADNYFFIDNFYLRTPPACQEPFAFSLDSVSTNAAGFTWMGDTTTTPSYDIEWGPCGFTPGTGMTATVTTDSAYITGLTSSSCYDVYIQTDCGSSTSSLSGPFTFYTECDVFPLPWTESFENNALNTMPQCWERTGATTYWNTNNVTGSYNRAPNTGNNYLQIRWTSNTTQFAFTPKFHLNANESYIFSFYMVTDGYSNWNEVSTWMGDDQTAAAMITPVGAPMYFPTNATYQQFTYQIIPTDTGDYHFGVKVISDGVPWYLSFDDFNLQVDPNPCPNAGGLTASNITSSTADLDWGAIPSISSFNVEYGPQGYTQGSGTQVTGVTASNYTATSLTPNTYYDYYVQVVCGGTPGTWVGPYTFKTECVGALNGTYTVAGIAGPTNFATLDSAISVLSGCGVSGPVTFNIAAGTYFGTYQIGEIQGASSTNTITFNGAGAHATTVTNDTAATATLGQAIFDLDGAKHMTFKNMGVVNTGAANAYAFRLMNNADSNMVENCYVQADTLGGTTTASAIVLTGGTTSATTSGGDVDYFTLKNSEVVGGYYGFAASGTGVTTAYNEGITLEGNTFTKQYYYGARIYYNKDITIVDNSFKDFRNVYHYGMYLNYISDVTVERNYAKAYYQGLYLYQLNIYNASTTTDSRVVNNMLYSTNSYALYFYGNNVDVYHNTAGAISSNGCYFSTTANMDVRNNIFFSSSSYAVYVSTPTAMSQMDYNMYYTGGTNLAYMGAARADLAALQTAYPTLNTNSISVAPTFINMPDDLHLLGTAGNDVGDNTVGVLVDIDGDARPATGSTTVDMGADEYTPMAWDAVAVAVSEPDGGCGDSTVAVSVIVKNQGVNAITSMVVKADVSGTVNTTLSSNFTGSIASLGTDTITVGTINMYNGGSVDVMGYVELANDGDGSNDSTAVKSASFKPYEPDFYAPDTVCATADSATFAAVPVAGAMHGWYANATDTVAVAEGDSFTFPVAGGAQTDWYLGYTGSADSLLTTTIGGNGSSGNMFDIYAKQTVTITGFSQVVDMAGAGATAEIWYRPNSYVGNISSNAGWILLGQAVMPSTTPSPGLTVYPISFNVTIPAGQTYGFYVTLTTGSVDYTNGTAVGNVLASNNMFDVLEGNGGGYFSVTFTPRVFNGQVFFGNEPCSDIKKLVSLPLDPAPTAAFTNTPSAVTPTLLNVAFDASTSAAGDTYAWDFGDGATGTGMTTTHDYTANGTYIVELTVTNGCGTSTSTDTIVVEGISVEENFFNGSVQMYPNPSTGKVNLSIVSDVLNGNMQVQVVDLFGRVVMNDLIENANAEWNKSYDLSALAAGTYVIQVQSNAGTYNHRLVMTK